MSQATRDLLMDAAVTVVRAGGMRAATARAIAEAAGSNQALVFYHFGGVDELLQAAFDRDTRAMVADYASQLEGVRSFEELYAVGLHLGRNAARDGSAALLSQVLAAAHHDPVQADLLAHSLTLWRGAVEVAVRRILGDAIAGADVDRLTSAIAAATVGMITLDAIPGQPLGATLESIGPLPKVLDRATRLLPKALLARVLGSSD